jgi:C-terminal processing protease CtpA/Prc
MVIDRINGTDAAALKAAGDFSVLSPPTTGVLMTLQVRDGVGATASREVQLRSAVYDLSPVTSTQVLTSPRGAKVGYLNFTEFVDAALTPLDTAFRSFRNQGVTQLVLDLRYNGGGSVDVARRLASGIAGTWAQGQTFTLLSFNDKRQAENIRFRFDSALGPQALNLSKVYVLTGPRSCSASEMVVNGLKPFVDVVQIGGTTCGKPFGFQPVDHCGLTYSAVNFEAFNAVDGGRYYSGITPRCAVADDVDRPLGHPAEAMTAAALGHIDGGTCPVGVTKPLDLTGADGSGPAGRPVRDGGPVPGMVLR